LAQEVEEGLQNLRELAETAEAQIEQANLEDLQRFTREVVLRRMDNPATTNFFGYRWRKGPGEDSYTVQWILRPNKAWQLEVLDLGDSWRLVYCDEVRGGDVWR
jgi:hypothetical protein